MYSLSLPWATGVYSGGVGSSALGFAFCGQPVNSSASVKVAAVMSAAALVVFKAFALF